MIGESHAEHVLTSVPRITSSGGCVLLMTLSCAYGTLPADVAHRLTPQEEELQQFDLEADTCSCTAAGTDTRPVPSSDPSPAETPSRSPPDTNKQVPDRTPEDDGESTRQPPPHSRSDGRLSGSVR